MPTSRSATVAISVLDEHLTLGPAGPHLADQVASVWHDALDHQPSSQRSGATLPIGPEPAPDDDPSGAPAASPATLRLLSRSVTSHLIGSRAGTLVLLRGAAMADPQTGAGIVLIGAEPAEWATVLRALRDRWALVSHELVGVREDRTLATYASPMLTDDGTLTGPRDLGFTVAHHPAPARVLVVLNLDEHHSGPPTVESLDTLDVLTAVAPQALQIDRLPRGLARLVEFCEAQAGAVRVTCRDADALTQTLTQALPQALTDLLGDAQDELLAPAVSDGTPAGSPEGAGQGVPASRTDTHGPISRGNLTDLHVFETGAAALVDGQVVVLSEVASALLAHVPPGGSTTLELLTHALVEQFGPPPPPAQATDVVREHVAHLVRHGALRDANALTTRTLRPEVVTALHSVLARPLAAEPSTVPPGVSGEELAAAAHRHRVLHSLVERFDGLDLPRSTQATWRAAVQHHRWQAEQVAGDLVRVMALLAGAGVRVLAVKGAVLAAQAYGDALARGAGDLDLLVSPEDLATARRVLLEAGALASPGYPAPDSGWPWRHLLWSGHELGLQWGATTIDLHWHLSPVRSGRPDFAALWARRTTVDVQGHEVATLGPYDAFAHSAAHAAQDHWRWLRSLVDVHRLASEDRTWSAANRPLRPDERLTVGLAVLALGRPASAPPIVDVCAAQARPVWPEFLRRQAGATDLTPPDRVPGAATLRALRAVRRAGGGPGDLARLLGSVALPWSMTAAQTSSHPAIVAPRVLGARARQIASQIASQMAAARNRTSP